MSGRNSSRSGAAAAALVVLAAVSWVASPGPSTLTAAAATRVPATPATAADLSKIKHVIVIMQENRSFDSYFGTYPGVNGLPRNADGFTSCLPDPKTSTCVRPYHSTASDRRGASHTEEASIRAQNGGAMDGFAYVDRTFCGVSEGGCPDGFHAGPVESMAYHDAREIPNYWNYADNYVLQDRMFSSNIGYSLPSHLGMVSGWSARCTSNDPASCVSDNRLYFIGKPEPPSALAPGALFSWTDITYMLHAQQVSWGYYIEPGTEPDCAGGGAECPLGTPLSPATPGIWNPLPYFTTVRENQQLGNIQPVSSFRSAALAGTLPAVSWIIPSEPDSEHPPGTIPAGQAWVTSLVNDVMRGPNWDSTAIFVSYDEWGGFYDHVSPPSADSNGYGIRVPGLLISPYARKGFVDHQTLSHDAYLKFIEDVFLGGARLDPATDGRPDPRTSVRESSALLGDLANEFDFTQTPRPPRLLSTLPPPGPASLAPAPPTGIIARALDGGARVSWVASPPNDGLTIKAYLVTPYIGYTAQPRIRVTGTTATFAGLTNGTTYRFRISAVNGVGKGAASASPAVIAGTPLPARAVTATAGVSSAVVAWLPPLSNNGSAITGYLVTPRRGTTSLPPISFASTGLSQTIRGLTAGQSYTFTISAKNARGIGQPSVASAPITAR